MKLPKFYNPFKAHIVELNNAKFAVRRWWFGWEYKEHTTFSNDNVYWWKWIEHTHRWCCVDTHEQAVALRDKVHVKKVKPMKVAKVYG